MRDGKCCFREMIMINEFAGRPTTHWLQIMETMLDPERTQADYEMIRQWLDVRPGRDMLDLCCGNGRMSRRMAADGANVTGLDISSVMLDFARRASDQRVKYLMGDMREFASPASFDGILFWWSSFGVFSDDQENAAVLTQCLNNLRPGGRLVMECFNPAAYLVEHSESPYGRDVACVTNAGDIMVDRRTMSPTGKYLEGERFFAIGSERSTEQYRIRAVMPEELATWLRSAGFASVELFAKDGRAFDLSSWSIVAVATRADRT